MEQEDTVQSRCILTDKLKEYKENIYNSQNNLKAIDCRISNNRSFTINERKKLFEYKLIKFIAENNLPLNKIQAVTNFLKTNLNDENDLNIFKSIKLSRRKMTIILNQAIKPIIQQDLEDKLDHYPFSIIMDESTDISRKQQCLILVQFYNIIIIIYYYRKNSLGLESPSGSA